jgi:hypothetical protein
MRHATFLVIRLTDGGNSPILDGSSSPANADCYFQLRFSVGLAASAINSGV